MNNNDYESPSIGIQGEDTRSIVAVAGFYVYVGALTAAAVETIVFFHMGMAWKTEVWVS